MQHRVRGQQYIFQSAAAEGTKWPDRGPSTASLLRCFIFFMFWHFLFHPLNRQNLDCGLTERREKTTIFFFHWHLPTIKELPSLPLPLLWLPHGRHGRTVGEKWEKCHRLIKGCSRFFLRSRWGLEQRSGSARIVTHSGDVFFLGAAGPCAKQAAPANKAASVVVRGKDTLSLCIRQIDINCTRWASSWPVLLVFCRDSATHVVYICLLQSGNMSCLYDLKQQLD